MVRHKYKVVFLVLLLNSMLFSCNAVNSVTPTPTWSNDLGANDSASTPTSTKTTIRPTATIDIIPTQAPTSTTMPATPMPIGTPERVLTSVLPGYLAFSVVGSNEYGIAMIKTDGSGFHWVVTKLPGFEWGDYSFPSWSPDGHQIAFILGPGMGGGDDPEICKSHIDGNQWERITYSSYYYGHIAWSPNGDRIAFDSYSETETGITMLLYILDLNSGSVRSIADVFRIAYYPTWSPDGQKIAFIAESEIGKRLYIINADGSNLRQVTDYPLGGGRFSWSPDGQQIAYRSADGCGDICILNTSNGDSRCLMNTEGGESDPAWSPDGEHIAYLATSESRLCKNSANGEPVVLGWQIYIMNADGSGITRLTTTTDTYLDLTWSPVPALHDSENYQITALGDNLNLRDEPLLNGAMLRQLHEGDIVTVLEGPVDADDYYWWKLRTEDGTEGWAVEVAGWYQPLTNP